MKDILIRQLANVEKIAAASKVKRLLRNPYRYVLSIFFRQFIYPRNKKALIKKAELFYGKQMTIALPASTDIYLTGGKSHESEIKLAKFIILNLSTGDHFLDIGAHYGYFTLLASKVTGENGKVVACEPATQTFALLQENCTTEKNIFCYRRAVSDTSGTFTFYEFPNLYSEYNTMDVEQFKNEAWFKTSPPKKIEIPAVTIDQISKEEKLVPKIIKIDVEGAEYHVIKGGLNLIRDHAPYFAMEYLEPARHNTAHQKAVQLLRDHGYQSYLIDNNGGLISITDIDAYLVKEQLESDNIIFKK